MKTYTHLLQLGEQARTRIHAGEPRTNLVRAVNGSLSAGEQWSYPHASDLFSLDQASYWDAEKIAEYEAEDRDHAEAQARYVALRATHDLEQQREASRRAELTDIERTVEDALLSSPQFRAFANGGPARCGF